MKIFFLSSGPILPLVGGRRLREYQILKELAKIAPVRALCLTKGKNEDDIPADHPRVLEGNAHSITFSFHPLDEKGLLSLFSLFGPHFAKGFSSSLLRTLRAELSDDDLIWASRLRMAKYISRVQNRQVYTVLDEHQIESDLMLDEAFQSWRRWSDGISAMQVARYERSLARKAQVVVTASPIDAHRVQRLSPKSQIKIIPFQLPLAPYEIDPSNQKPKENRIVFIADLEYPPNREAITWTEKEIMPRLKASLGKDIPEFVIATSDPIPKGSERGSSQSYLHYDTPEELGRILSESVLAVFPLRQGRGNRIHLLEAMAAGLPVVCTGKAIDGLTLRPSLDIFLANDSDGITSHIVRLLRDPELRALTGKNARDTVSRAYGNRELKESFLEILTALGIKR